MKNKIITRGEYIEFDSRKLHREYYGQFVTEATKNVVKEAFSVEKLIWAFGSDKNLNNIPLNEWDAINGVTRHNGKRLKEAGEVWSLSTGVCILKEAARQIVEENTR